MAEHKACADLVALTGDNASQHAGECSPCSGVDDSGTESGEDFRLLSPEILAEVQSALTRLEAALPSLDPVRREALVRLVTRLQSCLKLQPPSSVPPAQPPPTPPEPAPSRPQPQPPVKRYANRRQRQQRHTVGVSKEELADARRWLIETGQQSDTHTTTPSECPSVESHSSTNLNETQEQKAIAQVFRPVRYVLNQPSVEQDSACQVSSLVPEPLDNSGSIAEPSVDYSFPQEVPKADSGSSLLEYDPSLALFTPSQSVQIAVHKAAINKQISEEESKREVSKREESYDSDDGDVSSVEEEQALSGQRLEDAISSAQRLLQIATDKKTPTPSRFHDRTSKKQKMKRANTIDIPKPPNFVEVDASSADEGAGGPDNIKGNYNKSLLDQKLPPPNFQPKTESDLKFLAFLQQANKNDASAATYNPSARGGKPWTNRFVNLKTAFESTPETKSNKQKKSVPPSVTQNWQNATKAMDDPVFRQVVHSRTPQPLQSKLTWNAKQDENNVVVGSLTVKSAPVNKFSHAPKSAFKPIEKKPLTQSYKFDNLSQPTKIQSQGKAVKKPQPIVKNKQLDGKNTSHLTSNNNMTTSATGTVKQLATEKFSGEAPTKPIIKQYPAIQDKQFNSSSVKQHPFVEQVSKQEVKKAPVPIGQPLSSLQYSSSILTAQKQFSNQGESEKPKVVKIPQKTQEKVYKDVGEFSPPKQYINSPPLSQNYSEAFHYPTDTRNHNSLSTLSSYQRQSEVVKPEDDPVAYYSQHPAFVQHTTYNYPSQPEIPSHPKLDNPYPLSPEPPREYPAAYSQQSFNGSYAPSEDNDFDHEIKCHYSKGSHSQNGQIPSYSINGNDDRAKHVFSEESLVPNPLVVGQVYRQKPVESQTYETPPAISLNEAPLTHNTRPAHLPYNLYENNSSQGSLSSSKFSDSSSSLKQYLNIPYDYGQDVSPGVSNSSKSPYFEDNVNSSGAPSPQCYPENVEENEISVSEGAEIHTAVARVMGQTQCQKAVTVSNRTQHRYDDDRTESDSLLRTLLKSPHSPTNLNRKQSLEVVPTFIEPPPLAKSPKSKTTADYSYPAVVKPPTVVVTQQPQSFQNKPVSTAASAFRPLISNLSKPPESETLRPPVPPSPPVYRKSKEPDTKLVQFSHKISTSNLNKHYESELIPRPYPSSPSKSPSSTSPSFPNVLQKSESWHQLVKEHMAAGRHPPPKSPRLAKTKSSHSLAFPKQYEAHLTPDTLAGKQSTVDQYLRTTPKQSVKTTKQTTKQKKTVSIVKLDENLENVDEAFESLFQEVAKRK